MSGPDARQLSPAEVQAVVRKLHNDFCDQTRRGVPLLPGLERLWWDLLRIEPYLYDGVRLGADVRHLVRYLEIGIRDGKRNAGCLKLINFLQPERFFEDLAEARVQLKPKKAAPAPAAPVHVTAPDAAPMTEEQGKETAAKFRSFLKGMRQ